MGQKQVPIPLLEAARVCRTRLAEAFSVAVDKREGAQGDLISAIAEAMGDPDAPVRRWLRQRSFPLGITNLHLLVVYFPRPITRRPMKS